MELMCMFTEVYLNNQGHQWEKITGTRDLALIIVKSQEFSVYTGSQMDVVLASCHSKKHLRLLT